MDRDQLTLAHMFERARRDFGDRQIVSREPTGIESCTYAQLFERVDRLAHALASLGVHRGDRVATAAWNHRRHLELYLAVTAYGAVLHTVNARLGRDVMRAVIEHAGDVALFAEDDIAADHAEWFRSRTGRPVVTFEGASIPGTLAYESLLADQPVASFVYPRLDEGEPAAMAYSSATTGRPKGVVYSHRALYLHTMMLCMKDTWAISESDSVLPIVPMFHVNAWGLPFASIWMGARLILPGKRPASHDLVELLPGVTFAAAVPTVWIDVFNHMEKFGLAFPRLRTIVSGGAPLPASLLRQADRLGVPLIHSYGMTEASPLVLVGQIRSDVEPTDERRLRQGFVVPGLDYRVEGGPYAAATDTEQRGELWLRGPWIVDGYERDERSAAAFADGWYATGDIVTVDDHGYIHVVDRKADLIKSGGEWISTLELETALSAYPGISAAAVIGVPDPRWQERPRAYIVTTHSVDEAEVKDWLAKRFPRFWVPDQILTVESLPLTSVGKFDKRRLRAESAQESAT